MELNINFLEMLKESFTLAILIVFSIIMLTFALERWWFYRKIHINVDDFLGKLKKLLEDKKHKEALDICHKTPGPVARIAGVALENHSKSKDQVSELVNAARIEERLRLESFLGILGTLGNVTPFVGLFGTVVGIIKAFHDLAQSGSGGPSVVAAGIAEALVATAGGLLVAIPAVIFYNYFLKRVKNYSIAMETTQMRLLVYMGLD